MLPPLILFLASLGLTDKGLPSGKTAKARVIHPFRSRECARPRPIGIDGMRPLGRLCV